MIPHGARIRRRLEIAVAVVAASACSGQPSCGSCSCLAPLPADYAGLRIDNAISARVSKDGFAYINQNWAQLIKAFTTNPILIDVGCTSQSGFLICDQDTNNACGAGEKCTVSVLIQKATLTPTSQPVNQAQVNGTAELVIKTGRMKATRTFCTCPLFCCRCNVKCYADFDSTRSGRGHDTFTVPLNFSIDTKWGRLTRIEIPTVGGLSSLESGDLVLNDDGGCILSFLCDFANLGFIKDYLFNNILVPQLRKQIQSEIDKQVCRGCMAGANCSAGPLEGTCCPTGSVCQTGRCNDSGKCLPKLFGMQGGLAVSSLLASFGGPAGGAGGPTVPVLVALGGSVGSNTGLTLGTVGGAQAPTAAAPCVPDLPPPPPKTVIVPDFDTIAATRGATGYQVGFALSQYFMQTAAYAVHRAGGMCLTLDAKTTSILTTGTFKSLLPSIGLVAGTATKDAPVMINLRPTRAPSILIGEGTIDPVTKKPDKPLLTLGLSDVVIDFYVLIDDRFARIFTLTLDVSLPLSLVVEGGCSGPASPPGVAQAQKLTLALGDLKQLFGNVKTANAEIIAEDPQVLAQLLPLIIGVAEPALAKALKPIPLPDVNGLLVKIAEPPGLKGLVPSSVSGQYEQLGGFASLRLVGGTCAAFAPRTIVRRVDAVLPPAEAMRARADRPIPWPAARIEIEAQGDGRAVEHAWRVDEGLWSTWFDGPTLTVEHPRFLAQGRHTIEVRSRVVDDADTIEAVPARVPFLVDWEGPAIALEPDPDRRLLRVSATDAVTPADRIRFAYRLGDGATTDFGSARPVDLLAVEALGGRVEVFARDEAGHVTSSIHRVPVASPPAARPESPPAPVAVGCATAGGGLAAALAGFLALARRRKAKPCG